MSTWFWIGLAVLVLFALLWDPVWSRLGAPQMAPWTLRRHLKRKDRDLLLVDVRTPLEYRSFHIAGALNIPVAAPDSKAQLLAFAKAHPDQDLIILCMTGHRSPPPTRMLARQGVRAWNLTLGMVGWKLVGGKSVSGPEPQGD